MMPDLPNVGWERDIESFREFFENPAFRTGARRGCACWGAPRRRCTPGAASAWRTPTQPGSKPPTPPPARRWPEAVPHAGHPRHRAVRAVEERAVSQLCARQGGLALGVRCRHSRGLSGRPDSVCTQAARAAQHACCPGLCSPAPACAPTRILAGGPGGTHPGLCAALGAHLPHPARHPHAPGVLWRGEGQPARAGPGAHGAPGVR